MIRQASTLKNIALPLALLLAAPLSGLVQRAHGDDSTPKSAEHVRGGMFDASSPQRLRDFMDKLGYVAELARDDYGDPIIHGRISSTDYSIQFYECENGELCNSVQFVADTAPPADLSLEKVNTANQRWRYARVSVAGPTLRIQMDVNLDGGVTASNFEDTLYIWRRLVERFEREFPPASRSPADMLLNNARP